MAPMEYPCDQNVEIEHMAALKLPHEADICFSKNGIIDQINKTLSDRSGSELWMLYNEMSPVIFKYWVKKSGSELSPDSVFISETTFPPDIDLDVLARLINAPNLMDWDKSKKFYKVNSLDGREIYPAYGLSHFQFLGSLGIKARDFREKGFTFTHDGAYYRYSSSLPDEEELDKKDDAVQATTLINC